MKPRFVQGGQSKPSATEKRRRRENKAQRKGGSKKGEKEGEEAISRPINASYILCLDRPTLEIFN